MAKLYFKIASDWEEVVRLRNEIAKLKQELKNMDSTQSPAVFQALNTQLSASTQRMDELVNKAAQAGAVMEGDFRKKIFDASQTVNGFTEKIIAQKNAIGSLQTSIRKNKELYRTITSRGNEDKGLLSHIREQEKALGKERDALFNLTQAQANARLSVKKLRDEYSLYKNDGKQVVETNQNIGLSLGKALGVIGGVAALKKLGSEIIRVRGEFQSMQTAIETMVGKNMAGQLIPQIKELAKISPLTMTDMVGAEKMMLGFNIQAEDTIKYLKALSDISMGESSKFNSLTLAFSQMSATGKLMGQDLNQMINAGFNPLQVIAEKTGKSIATLKEEMSKGAVSAEMVQQAFIDATSAGGKFYGMSENASKTINGQISMMQDAWDNALNEMGQSSEGFIMSGIQATTSLIQNYETVGKVLVGLIATYGTYRTAVMLVTAAESKHTLVEIGLTNARVLAKKAQLALNAAMLTNPYVMLAVAVGGLVTVMWAMSDSTTAAARAQKEYNVIKEKASKREQEHKQKIEELLTTARDESLATLTRQKSLEELRKEYPKIFEKYDLEKLKLEDILKLKQQINEEDSKRSVHGRKEDYSSLKQTVSNQKRYLELFDNPELRKNLSESDKMIWKEYAGNQSYVQVKEAMEKNAEKLKLLQKDVLEDNIAAYKVNLKNYSKEKLEAELKMAQSSASKRNGFNVGGMMVKGGELESIISSINGALAEKKSPSIYKEDYEKAKKEWEEAKKKLSGIEKDKAKFTTKQYEDAKKLKETTEKAYKKLGGVTDKEIKKQESEAEKLRKQQQKSAEELLSLRRQNQQDEINLMKDGSDKRLKQIELDYQKELDVIRKKEQAWSKANGGKLTAEQSVQISLSFSQAEDKRNKSISEMNKEEFEAMNRYLKEYGTFQQKKEAIAKEYSEKISRSATEWDKMYFQKQMDEALQNIALSELKQSMDWEQVFGNLDKVSSDTLKKLKSNLKDFIATQKALSPENLKELVDAVERIDEKLSEHNPFESMSVSFKSLKTATDAERIAQEAYNKALKESTDEEKKNAKATLENAKDNKQKALSEATIALRNGVNEIGQYVEAGNQVIGIMETLGLNTPKWLEGAMAGFGEMLNGLGNIDLTKPMSIVTGGLQTIKGALSGITSLGGVINWNGSNAKEVQEAINKLTDRNETLGKSIDRLTDVMEKEAGSKSISAYKQAYEYQQEQNANTLQIAREQARYSGSHHSWQKYMGWTNEQIQWARKNVDENFSGTESLWGLSPEQMKMLLSNADIYEQISGAGKGGYGNRVMEKLEAYADNAEKLDELTEKINESLMQVSFDSLRDSFLDSLMDMDKDAKSFSEDFSEYMQRALLNFSIGEMFDEDLKEWYTGIAELMKEQEGKLTEDQLNAARQDYDDMVQKAIEERNKIAELTGYTGNTESTSQSSTGKGFQTMSQDTGNELNGRFTALQIAGEEIKNQNIIQSQSLNLLTAKADTILSINTEVKNIADETRTILANSYLELVQISENTGNSAKYLKDIKADIAEVKKNTSKL